MARKGMKSRRRKGVGDGHDYPPLPTLGEVLEDGSQRLIDEYTQKATRGCHRRPEDTAHFVACDEVLIATRKGRSIGNQVIGSI